MSCPFFPSATMAASVPSLGSAGRSRRHLQPRWPFLVWVANCRYIFGASKRQCVLEDQTVRQPFVVCILFCHRTRAQSCLPLSQRKLDVFVCVDECRTWGFVAEEYCSTIAVRLECYSSSVCSRQPSECIHKRKSITFHFSISSCLSLYCFSRSSRTFFRPSEFVLSAGTTSLTVRSTRTPLIIRKHLRSPGSGSSVSSTSL